MDALRLSNVRSIADMPMVPLRPLTILVGKNSVGKSSFIRWLPLLAQSLDAPGSSPILWSRRDRGLVDYGSFQETLRRGASPAEIRFGWRGTISGPRRYEAELSLTSSERATYVSRFSITVDDIAASIEIDRDQQITNIEINNHQMSSFTSGENYIALPSTIVPTFRFRRRSTLRPNSSDAMADSTAIRDRPRPPILLPALWRKELTKRRFTKLNRNKQQVIDVFQYYGIQNTEPLDENQKFLVWGLLGLQNILQQVQSQTAALCGSVVYIAPFRAPPQRSERNPEPSSTLDSQGAALLNFMEGLSNSDQMSLSNWLHETLGFRLAIKKEGPYSELRVDQGDDQEDNLADVGFGIGQVLPVAVHLWNSSRPSKDIEPIGSLVIMEQPELHLHPAHQAAVGRMLCRHAAQNSEHNSRILAETHSEALLNAVGEEIGAGRIGREDVSVVVFERRNNREPVNVRVVEFDDRGYLLPPWPFGFFAA